MLLTPYQFQTNPLVTVPLIFDGERLSMFQYHDGLEQPLARTIDRPWLHPPDPAAVRDALAELELPAAHRIPVREWYPPGGYVHPAWSLYHTGHGEQDFILRFPKSTTPDPSDPAMLCPLDPHTLAVGHPIFDAPDLREELLEGWIKQATEASANLMRRIAAGA